MKKCLVCGEHRCNELINFGKQPVSHHFFDGSHEEGSYPFALGQCESCGLVQSVTPVPPDKLVPHFDWISYNEPEAHLDSLVETLCTLPGITKEANIGGLSYKEDSTLRHFREKGFQRTWRLDPGEDLGISNQRAGIEIIQGRIRPSLVACLQKKHGAADILIARHIIEHTNDPPGFMQALRQMVKPTGFVIFEVPDCARAFDLFDYTVLWEDHTLYFVEPTFLTSLDRGGLAVARFERYPARYENCLVAITKPETTAQPVRADVMELAREKERAAGFARGLNKRRQALRDFLAQWRKHGKIALFGAGHQAVMFINVMQISDLIEFVVDDHPRKCGLRMPGSRVPIVSSHALSKENIKLCLTSLSAASESKVIQKHRAFIDAGGTFASIFPVKGGSLVNFLAGQDAPA
jgi:hypothetical protein